MSAQLKVPAVPEVFNAIQSLSDQDRGWLVDRLCALESAAHMHDEREKVCFVRMAQEAVVEKNRKRVAAFYRGIRRA